ncbi:MAG TPA: GDSL-type esterase/lipase family protein [Magnetospirillum sp.]|nr:GDSL-type esterase/lipase family protein [Magnetospirillum sp.]
MRICFIGDSFINGTGDPDCLGWVGRVSAQARHQGVDLTVYNLGIRRDTSTDIAARWRDEARARQPIEFPGLLVFSFGVNDCTEDAPGRLRVELADSVANARAILGEAAGLRPTLMVGPPPIDDDAVNSRIRQLSAALADVCGAQGIPYLDVFGPLERHPLWRREVAQGDGAHPGAAGYAVLAQLVATWPAWQQALAG